MIDDESPSSEHDAFIESIALMRKFRLDQRYQADLKKHRAHRSVATRKVRKAWGPALDTYFRATTFATDFGRDLVQQLQSEIGFEEPHLVNVMGRLHAQACLVTFEIWSLLASGYGQGAFTRWRTLHEIATTMLFLHEHGEDAALRFWMHGGIERSRLARELDGSGLEPFDAATTEEINADRESMIGRWGPIFAKPYGWAAEALGSRNPSFKEIEESLDTLPNDTRWAYKWASNYVHPQAVAITISMGLPMPIPGSLSGPSVFGVNWPGHAAMVSLQQATVALATLQATDERLIRVKVLTHLAEETSELFGAAAKTGYRTEAAETDERD